MAIVSSFTTKLSIDLGYIEYQHCLAIQKRLVSLKKVECIPDMLLFLEHEPSVYTIGRKADPANFANVDTVATERGGDVTYHSRGQLVVYPIMDIRVSGRRDVRAFVRKLEQGIIDALSVFGFNAQIGDEPGIWVDGRKVGSIGLALEDYISYHGISVNYSPEVLSGFSRIRACGVDPTLIGFVDIDRRKLVDEITSSFSSIFGQFTEIDRKILQWL